MSINKNIYNLVNENLAQILLLREDRVSKADGSYVTKGDLFCQDLIIDYLKSQEDSFLVVSEEMDLTNFQYDETKNYVVIDPIDGTENFTSGLKEWGISVSIFKEGKHQESMIMLPELGLGLITGDRPKKYSSRIHGLSSSLRSDQIKHFKDNFKVGCEYRITGCCVYNMYNVITGSFSTSENSQGAWVWDIIAGLNLALEQGLKVEVEGEEYRGEFLDPAKKYRFKIKNN